MTDRCAVLLMAYGAVEVPEEVPAYLQDIRGGRPPSPELVAQVQERYRLMGGGSPLLGITARQAAALEACLNGRGPGPFRVYFGMRHSKPTIREAVEALLKDGHTRLVAAALTPFYSRLSVGAYLLKLDEALGEAGRRLDVRRVRSWNDEPLLHEAWARKLLKALGRIPEGERDLAAVLFTAHSLPARILEEQDPYPRELAETVERVARRCGLRSWGFAYQSRGATQEPWLGPDAGEEIERLAGRGVRRLVLVPIGFVSDHMETLYDDDILYQKRSRELGVELLRAESLNDDPLLARALAEAVRKRLAGAPA